MATLPRLRRAARPRSRPRPRRRGPAPDHHPAGVWPGVERPCRPPHASPSCSGRAAGPGPLCLAARCAHCQDSGCHRVTPRYLLVVSRPPERPPPRLIGMTDLLAGPPPTLLPDDPAAAELAGGERRRRRTPAPGVACSVGRAGPAGPGRRRRRPHRLRLCPRRLPPQPRPAAAQRLEGSRTGAVGARAQPRVPALPGPAGVVGAGDRRDRGVGALLDVPARLQRDGGRRAAVAVAESLRPAASAPRSAPNAITSVGSRGPRSASTSRR